ncbi:MAG: hypothetical protein QM811_14360 [Pirellulales bacterium]
MSDAQHFTGRQRRLKTRNSVKWGDKVARAVIGIGGIGTIVAVLLICFFLVWEVIPLFSSPTLSEEFAVATTPTTPSTGPVRPREWRMLGDGVTAWELNAQGEYRVFCVADAQALTVDPAAKSLFADMTAIRVLSDGNDDLVVIGTKEGKLRIARLGSVADEVSAATQIPKQLADQPLVLGGSIWRRKSDSTAESTSPSYETLPEYAVGGGKPLRHVDVVARQASGISKATAYFTASIDENGDCRLALAAKKKTGGEMRVEEFPAFSVLNAAGRGPDFMRLSGLGEYLYCAWSDGIVRWYEIRNPAAPRVIKELDVVEEKEGA